MKRTPCVTKAEYRGEYRVEATGLRSPLRRLETADERSTGDADAGRER